MAIYSLPCDQRLSDCWCEECTYSVSSLRGKSWSQIRIEDLDGMTSHMNDFAFLYYLPALLSLSIRFPDELHIACNVNRRFTILDVEDTSRSEKICDLVGALSKAQRSVLCDYLDWLSNQGWQSPELIVAAKKAIATGQIEPCSSAELMRPGTIARSPGILLT